MAIKTETFYISGREFTRTYSDANKYVMRDGISYSEACDPAEFNRTYTEGDLILDSELVEEQDEYAQVGRILMGVEE